ncbi:MAG: TolC family protein [Polyangiales bacterium]
MRITIALVVLSLAGAARAQGFDLAHELEVGVPLTSERAVQRALASAPSLERAEALARAADAALFKTRAALLPRLDTSARYTHIDGFPDTRIAGMKISIPRDQGALSARLSYPVSDLIFVTLPLLAGSGAQADASRAQIDAERARVRLSAREAYLQLARARGALAVATRALVQARALQASIDAGVQAGVRAPSDGASALARVAAAEQAVVAAESSADVADASLRTLLDEAEGERYGVTELAAEPSVLPATEVLIQRARAQRAEVLALRKALLAQRKGAKAQRASGYPHLGVYAGGDYAQPNRYQIPPRAVWQSSWEVGASLTYAPNDTVVAVRKGREDDARAAATEADLRALDRSLVLEVRTACATLGRTEQNLSTTRAAEAAAQAAYEQRDAELRGGTITLADVFASELELNQARLNALDALVDDRLARARLAYALGE